MRLAFTVLCLLLLLQVQPFVAPAAAAGVASPCRPVTFKNGSVVDLGGAVKPRWDLPQKLTQIGVAGGDFVWGIDVCSPTFCTPDNPSFLNEENCKTRFRQIDTDGAATAVNDMFVVTKYHIAKDTPDGGPYEWTATVEMHCVPLGGAAVAPQANSFWATFDGTTNAITVRFVLLSHEFCAVHPTTTTTTTAKPITTTTKVPVVPSHAPPPPPSLTTTPAPSHSSNNSNGGNDGNHTSAPTGDDDGGLTWGAVFLIVLGAFCGTWLLLGLAVKYFAPAGTPFPGAGGLSSAWSLAKDGAYFVYCRLTGKQFYSLELRGGRGFSNKYGAIAAQSSDVPASYTYNTSSR
jgi:hypothetical protein